MSKRTYLRLIGYILFPCLWIVGKYVVHISGRFLPDPLDVLRSATLVEPNILVHIAYTTSRFTIGFLGGTAFGVAIGLAFYRSATMEDLLMPIIQSSRAVPAVAIIPFFLLWFGFSEEGKYLLVLSGTAFNIAVATLQIMRSSPERYATMFASFRLHPSYFPLRYGIPFIAENILPTLRFSLSAAIGLIVASEMLGSQVGLGYLAQSARSTFSLDLLFLTVILLGILSALADQILVASWKTVLFWQR